MNSSRKLGLWLAVFALAYGCVMLSLDGFRLCESSPYHRQQAEALSHGHLALADSITALQPGLVWHQGVQQVWGLGIGLWLLPGTALWHLFSSSPFPDRIALGLAFAWLAFFAGGTGIKLIPQGQRNLGLGMILLPVLCPALWTMARASQLVFEETVLYALLLSLGILISLVRVSAFHSLWDYIGCCGLGAFAVWFRPTHAVYGLAATVIATALVWQQRRRVNELFWGLVLWPLSLGLLAWTNAIRFGSPTVFGHHLTVSSGTMIYLTRFGNPYLNTPFLQALKELFGLLFLVNPHGANAFADNLFPGQAPFVRWRRLDLTAFDLSYAILIGLCIAGALTWLFWHYRRQALSQTSSRRLVIGLLFWSLFSMTGLGSFYLYFPPVASRYLFDFAPAWIGVFLLGCQLLPIRWGKFVIPALAGWMVFELAAAKVPKTTPVFQPPVNLAQPKLKPNSFAIYQGSYTPDRFPTAEIAGNGYGWEAGSGFAGDVISLAVDNPEFVTLEVSPRRAVNGEPAKPDVYRAQLDGTLLTLREVAKAGENLKVTFEIPPVIRARRQIEMLFLCFSDGYDADDRNSERFLYLVQWR